MAADAQTDELGVRIVLIVKAMARGEIDEVRHTSSAFADGELFNAAMLAPPVSLYLARLSQLGPVGRIVPTLVSGHGSALLAFFRSCLRRSAMASSQVLCSVQQVLDQFSG